MDPRSLRPRLPDATSVLSASSRGPLARLAAKTLVAGEYADDAVRVSKIEVNAGHRLSWMPLVPMASSADDIITSKAAYLSAIENLSALGSENPDITLDISGFGVLAQDVMAGLLIATLREIAGAARNAGVTITLTIPEQGYAEAAFVLAAELRQDFPETGLVVPTRLRAVPGQLSDLAKPGFRLRLTTERLDAEIGMTSARESGSAFIDITKELLAGSAVVGFDTDDALLLDIAASLVERHDASAEVVVPLGTLTANQQAWGAKHAIRTVVPYGTQPQRYVTHLLGTRPGVALGLTNPRRRR